MLQNKYFRLILIIINLGIFNNVHGSDNEYKKDRGNNRASFYNKEPRGFLWYEDPIKNRIRSKKETELDKLGKTHLKTIESAKLRNEELKKNLEDAITILLDDPTIENAISAQKAQKQIFDRSESVSEAWLIAALMDAGIISKDMNPNVLHRKISKEEKIKQYIEELQLIAKDWGLFLYVIPNCKYCEKFLPIILELKAETGFQVLAISEYGMDYRGIKGQRNNGFLDQFNPEKLAPVLFLVNKDGKRIYPIARGLTDIEKLKENILNMVKFDQSRINKLTRKI